MLKAWSKTSQTAAEGKASGRESLKGRNMESIDHLISLVMWEIVLSGWEQLESRNIISKQKMTKPKTKNMNKKKKCNQITLFSLVVDSICKVIIM